MEDFVTFEIAKKLKEKGFKEPCLAYYTKDLNFYYNTNSGQNIETLIKSFNSHPNRICRKRIDAPTISQVLKWLRDKLEIDILPNIIISWTDDLKRIRLYSCNIYSPKLNKAIETEYFDSYEEAVIAGIKRILDKE